jgi:Domain of unknown function (DUF4382)
MGCNRSVVFICVLFVFAAAVLLISCGGSSGNSSQTGTVNLTVSDPTTCAAPTGPFSHIYVTVTDVKIHQSASASSSDSGWVDLTPNLMNSPVQVDLLGAASQCFLAHLGSIGIQPGSYQQIRIFLANGTVNLSTNKCGSTANCAMLTTDLSNTPLPVQLSSESQTGIKIPSGQIAGGKFTIGAGETRDLNIDFNACASIVFQGDGQYRLKPVMHAGEVALNANSISGTVIDGMTTQAIVGGHTVVALEQKDSAGVDRVIMETVTDANGGFSFCPVPAGTYDIVAVAENGAGSAYAATVITGVQTGNSLGKVPLTPAAAPASITGQITTTTGSAGTVADLSVSALQSIGSGVLVTVPLAHQSMAAATLTTATGAGCPANTDCASYTLSVPAMNPSVGTFSSSGTQTPSAPASGAVNYMVDAIAFVPGSAGQLDCSPSDLQTNQTSASTSLTVTAGGSVTAATLAFNGCQ